MCAFGINHTGSTGKGKPQRVADLLGDEMITIHALPPKTPHNASRAVAKQNDAGSRGQTPKNPSPTVKPASLPSGKRGHKRPGSATTVRERSPLKHVSKKS